MQTDDPLLRMLTLAQHEAFSFLSNLDRAPVGATVDVESLRQQLTKPLTKTGLPPEQVITELVSDVAGGLIGSTGGRFFAWVIGGSVPAALAADWLTSTWDQNACLFAPAPAAAVVEEVAGEWLRELFGLPEGVSFGFVTGCQMAHVTCLAAARHRVLAAHGWDVEREGLFGAPRVRVVAGEQRHVTVDRAVRFLGFGTAAVEIVAADDQGRIVPDALREVLAAGEGPTIVCVQAGDVNTGSFDAIADAADAAEEHGAWLHVD